MTQFGTGPQLAAQCPRPPTPDGWRPWTDADGPVPNALAKRAAALAAADPASVDLGATESFPLPGVTALIRVEPQAWSRDATGTLVEGCFRVGAIYLPAESPAGGQPAAPSTDNLTKTIGILTAVSLTVGTVATLATWGRSK